MSNKYLGVVLLGLALVAMVSCSDSEEANDAGTRDTAATSSSATTSSAPAPTSAAAVTVPGEGQRPAGPTRTADGGDLFESPTGNIGCAMDASYVRCEISETDWEQPVEGCDGFGSALLLDGDRGADFLCVEDSVFGGATLAYGESITAGDMNCTSTEAAMVCWSSASGRGFALSRERYVIT